MSTILIPLGEVTKKHPSCGKDVIEEAVSSGTSILWKFSPISSAVAICTHPCREAVSSFGTPLEYGLLIGPSEG